MKKIFCFAPFVLMAATLMAQQPVKVTDGTNTAGVTAGGAVKVDGSATTQPVSGTVTTNPPANASTNLAQVAGTTTDTNSGNKSAGTIRVVVATDQPTPTNPFNVQQTSGPSLETTPMPSPTTTNAGTECAIVSAASTNATNCKASAGNFYGYELLNTTTTTYYLRLYNTSGSPTCSSGTGFIRSIPIPPAGSSGQVGGIVRMSAIPVGYSTGISFCITGGSSSTDNTNAAVGIFGAILYK